MAVTYNEPEYIGANTWRVSWSSSLGSPPAGGYRLFKNGVQVGGGVVFVESWDFTLQPGEALTFEALDDANALPAQAWPKRLTLGWRPSATAAKYRIEEYVASAWTARKTIHDDGRAWYRWESRVLEDVTSHQFRVVPVGSNGNDGTPLAFAALMVREPDPPFADTEVESKFSYDAGDGKVTISA